MLQLIKPSRLLALAAPCVLVGCGATPGPYYERVLPPPDSGQAGYQIGPSDASTQAATHQNYRQVDGSSIAAPPERTILEELRETRMNLTQVEADRQQLESQLMSLSGTLEQLKQDNTSLQQLLDSFTETQGTSQETVKALEQRLQDLESKLREQMDQVLTERIQRVRVERELILAKIAEAERTNDG